VRRGVDTERYAADSSSAGFHPPEITVTLARTWLPVAVSTWAADRMGAGASRPPLARSARDRCARQSRAVL